MKKLLLIQVVLIFFSVQLSAQFIGKFNVAAGKQGKNKDSIKAILDYNILAKDIKNGQRKSTNDVNKLVASMHKITGFTKNKTFDTLATTIAQTPIDGLAPLVDTIAVRDTTSSLSDSKAAVEPCDELASISSLNAEKNNDGEYVFSFVDNKQDPVASFDLKQYNEALFYDKAKEALKSVCSDEEQNSVIETIIANMVTGKLFEKLLIASLEVNDDDVLAGELTIYKHIPVVTKTDTAKGKNLPLNFIPDPTHLRDSTTTIMTDTVAFTVYDIQVQFQDGFIENIKVLGKVSIDSHLLKYENAFPIPFSTRRDFRKLYDIVLYERTIFTDEKKNRHHISHSKLRLGDLLFYSQNLNLNVKDYSPENQVLKRTLTKAQDTVTINLNKERTSKILELKVFSDLKGIETDNPNGLIQFELSKKLNFWNNRHARLGNMYNIGYFNYITPYFTMNKIENDSKRLTVPYIGGQGGADSMKANVYASSLRLLQYQTYGLGVNVTGITIDVPGWKSVFSLNTGFYFGRTLFQDTARQRTDSAVFTALESNNVRQYGLNTFQIAPEITWQIFPDKRYGVTLSQRFINFKLLSNTVKQVRDSAHYVTYISSLKGNPEKINDYQFKRWLGSSEIFAFYQPSDYNKLFFRYRFNWDLDNVRENFHQMQIGILTYLAHTKKSKKEQQTPE